MVRNFLTHEYLSQYREELVSEMTSFAAKVEGIGEALLDCRGTEPKVKHSICSFARDFYFQRLPFLTFSPEENLGLPHFCPSVSCKIFHKGE